MNNKRHLKRIKLIAGSVALATLLSACSTRTNNEDNIPETVYVYVTATPTPTPNSYENNRVVQPTNTSETSATQPGGLINRVDISQYPTQTTEDDGLWADDTWFFFSEDPYVLPTIETDPNDEGYIEDSEIDSLLRIYNFFARVDQTINNFDYEQSIDDAINEARELIDFIFYGAEMDGTTFEELTEQGRQAVYERLQALDSRIMEYYPDYKTDLGELYNRVRNFASTTLDRARQAFDSHIDIDIDINITPTTETTMNSQRKPKLILEKNND